MSMFRNPAAEFETAPFILPDDVYQLYIDSVKAKSIVRKDGSETGIIQFNFKVVGGEYDGRYAPRFDAWYDDDGKNNNAMRIVLSALGIQPGTEAADATFKNQYPDLDLGFDEDSLEPNSGWEQVCGNVIQATVRKVYTAGSEFYNNKYSGFKPLNG
jgi:hypothetical protein